MIKKPKTKKPRFNWGIGKFFTRPHKDKSKYTRKVKHKNKKPDPGN